MTKLEIRILPAGTWPWGAPTKRANARAILKLSNSHFISYSLRRASAGSERLSNFPSSGTLKVSKFESLRMTQELVAGHDAASCGASTTHFRASPTFFYVGVGDSFGRSTAAETPLFDTPSLHSVINHFCFRHSTIPGPIPFRSRGDDGSFEDPTHLYPFLPNLDFIPS